MKQPFFIVGTGRCGSTLLYNILRAHDKVALTNESRVIDFLHFMTSFAEVPSPEARMFPLLEEVKLHGLIRSQYLERFNSILVRHSVQILEEFYAEEFADRDFTHWGDKLPSALAAQVMATVYPNTKYVVLMRDPRDFVASARAYTRRPQVRQKSPFFIGGMTLQEQAQQWLNTYRGCLEHLQQPLLLRYEDLVAEPLKESRRVLDYLGLDLQVDQIAKMTTRREFNGHGTAKSPEKSVGRWSADLDEDEIATIESVCGDFMARHGYELTTAPASFPVESEFPAS